VISGEINDVACGTSGLTSKLCACALDPIVIGKSMDQYNQWNNFYVLG